jgi:hypothetical protein
MAFIAKRQIFESQFRHRFAPPSANGPPERHP